MVCKSLNLARARLVSLGSAHLARVSVLVGLVFFSENESLGSASITESIGSASKSSASFTSLLYIY